MIDWEMRLVEWERRIQVWIRKVHAQRECMWDAM